MKEKKKYERPRIVEITKLEAIAGACGTAGAGNCKADSGTCPGLIAS